MIKKLASLSLLLLSFVASTAIAESKIAVLDTQRVLVESMEAKAISQQFQRELQSKEAKVKGLVEEIELLQEKLRKDDEIMSAAEQRRARNDIENKQIDYHPPIFTKTSSMKNVSPKPRCLRLSRLA